MTPTPTSRQRLGGIQHPAAAAALAAGGLIGSGTLALQDPLLDAELRLTDWLSNAPDPIAWLVYLPMQLGTIGASLALCVLVATAGRDRVLGLTMVGAVLTTWLLARGVKTVVDRGRPIEYLPDIDVRDVVRSDLGYASSHAAVAATATVMAMVVLPRGYRWVAPATAALVGVGRVVHGVHLPLDVIGGWSMGTLVALLGLAVVDIIERRSANRAAY